MFYIFSITEEKYSILKFQKLLKKFFEVRAYYSNGILYSNILKKKNYRDLHPSPSYHINFFNDFPNSGPCLFGAKVIEKKILQKNDSGSPFGELTIQEAGFEKVTRNLKKKTSKL